jgi:NDP-sugar pyrophosphorylase family protein
VSVSKETKETDVLILCGGLGTRFRAVREDIPKALAPINGDPFIDLLLNDLINQGFRRFILATGHLGSQLESHINQRTDEEYIISREPIPLGTGGAIKFAEKNFRSKQIFIFNGDSHIPFHFPSLFEFHKNCRADMSILLSSATKGADYGNVVLDVENRIILFSEKPSESTSDCINAGVYVINRSLLNSLQPDKQYSLEKDCLPSWIHANRLFGMLTDKAVCDIGTPERYINSQTTLLE